MPLSQKELLLSKMQEFDSAMQTANAVMQTMVRVRTEIYSIIGAMPETEISVHIEIPLTFYEGGNVIAWGDDSESFTPSTFRLVQQLWYTPDRFLSKEDFREGVQEDDESKNGSIRTCISRARDELEAVEFPYEIKTERGKGYRLRRL